MSFRLVILTPKGLYADRLVDELYVKTHDGVIGVMTGHIPLITPIEIAPLRTKTNGQVEFYVEFGGVLHVEKDKTIVLVNDVESLDDIDEARALASRERAEKRLNKNDASVDMLRAKASLLRSLARLDTIQASKENH